MYPVRIIGVDPGATTGIRIFDVYEDWAYPVANIQYEDQTSAWEYLLDLYEEGVAAHLRTMFVIERFDKRPGVVEPDYSAMYVQNDIRGHFPKDIEIVWQIPAQAKNLVKPPGKMWRGEDQLKRFGWYTRGGKHSNDATRHVIVYLVEQLRHEPTIRLGWPESKED